ESTDGGSAAGSRAGAVLRQAGPPGCVSVPDGLLRHGYLARWGRPGPSHAAVRADAAERHRAAGCGVGRGGPYPVTQAPDGAGEAPGGWGAGAVDAPRAGAQ